MTHHSTFVLLLRLSALALPFAPSSAFANEAKAVEARSSLSHLRRTAIAKETEAAVSPFFERALPSGELRRKALAALVSFVEKNNIAVSELDAGDRISRSRYRQAMATIRQETREQLERLLGAQSAERAVGICESIPWRQTIVADFAARCSSLGISVTDEQFEDVSIVCKNHLIPVPHALREVDRASYEAQTYKDRLVLEELRKVLSEPQHEVLRKVMAERFIINTP